MNHNLTAWLFDLYPSHDGLAVWLIDTNGHKYRTSFPYTPSFFMHVSDEDAQRVAGITSRFPFPVTLDRISQKEIYANQEWNVLRVSVHNTLRFRDVVRILERHFPHFVFFNSDIHVPQMFLYSTGLFPLAFGEYRIDGDGRLAGWRIADTFDAMEYTMPPLTTLKLANKPDFVSPKYRKSYQLEVSYDGRTYALESTEPCEVLHSLNHHLQEADPDIILTEYGDAILLPMLTDLSAKHRIPLSLNRDSGAGYFTTNETSYFSYGKIVHKDGAFELAGRWHLDTENSFMMGEASLDGVVEIARMTQLPVQHQSRSSIGTALSSMQLSWAIRNNYLIPAKKREPEDFKSAATLLLADRGGLIFQPKMGYHEQVAELDFVSMYPTIMVEHNVSPETVNCRCCKNNAVPELQYTICEKRIGIVPSTLRMVVRKRAFYKKEKKRLKKLGDPRWQLFDHRQNSLKWMLVTCFGYLGYKNARFGRIEAHESVNAYSRDAILRAKEIAEGKGYEFIHAIVDCLWIKKQGATEADYEALAAEVSAETGIDLSLEGIYRWILFPSSKMDPHIPTANKYVGYYTNGDIKIRGIEVRRRDTPLFLKRMQGEMLQVFANAQSIADVTALAPEALGKAKEFIGLLRSGRVDPHELVIRRHISQEADQYSNRSTNAEAVKALDEAGIKLKPGEMVEYIIVDATGKKKPQKAVPLVLYSLEDGYDIEKYTEMALKTIETLLSPFGWDVERLDHKLLSKPRKGVNGKQGAPSFDFELSRELPILFTDSDSEKVGQTYLPEQSSMAKKSLDISEIGYWSEIKIDIVRDYARAYSSILSARDNPRLSHVYIDAFSGAGIHLTKDSKELVLGSPTSVLSVDPPFHEYHFIDLDQENVDTLREIVSQKNAPHDPRTVYCYNADCNKVLLTDVFPRVRYDNYRRGLCLLDPFGLHLDWEVIQTAGEMGSMELFLNFPILDMNRNVLHHDSGKVDPKQTERMTRYWGDESWRKIAYSSQNNLFGYEEKTNNLTVVNAFCDRMRSIARFKHVSEPLAMRNSTGGIVYFLIFASQKPVALKIVQDIFNKHRDRRASNGRT